MYSCKCQSSRDGQDITNWKDVKLHGVNILHIVRKNFSGKQKSTPTLFWLTLLYSATDGSVRTEVANN